VIENPEKSCLLSTDVKNTPEKVLLPKFEVMGSFAQNDRQSIDLCSKQ
jgi:hypothetical protein